MGLKLEFPIVFGYGIWIGDVFWFSGPSAAKTLGSDSKNTSQIQIVRHLKKRVCDVIM